MRSLALAFLFAACLGLAGCSGGSAVDALQIAGPSAETTSAIARPEATIPGPADDAAPADLATAGMTALAPVPSVQPAALRVPEAPRVYRSRFDDAHPVNFGRIAPHHHAVHGVDVSRWQGEIDWPALRRHGANFAYIKATDGIDHIDPMFRHNWQAAARAGVKRGAYHFFYWCRRASDQAEWFIRNVPKEKGALPPVLDVEWNHQSNCKWRPSRAEILEKMQVFLDRLERHYGQRPVIYTTPDFYRDNLRGAFRDYPFWLRSVAAHPSEVYPGRDWVFWQYSGTGLSQGVDGKIDLNVFNGDEKAWHRWLARVAG